jgi:hypothetical protein
MRLIDRVMGMRISKFSHPSKLIIGGLIMAIGPLLSLQDML